MTKLNYIICILFLAASLAGCKKETTTTNNNTTNPLGSSAPTIPTDAFGALYAVNSNVYTQGVSQATGTAFAWFSSYSTTLQAGAVTCNGDSLSTSIPFTTTQFPWYESTAAALNGNIPDFSSDPVAWTVSGSSSVPAFNFTDNAPFPQVINYNVPATVSLSQSLTVTYNITNSYDVVICTIKGSKAGVNQTFTGTNSTVTFTSAQLNSTAVSGDNLLVQIMPVKLSPSTQSGKKYYFVKENAFAQYAIAQ